jgi:hypothetical protein
MRLAHTKSVAARRRNGLFSLAVFTQPSKLAAAITRPTKNAPMQENSKISLSTARIQSPLRERASALPEDGKKLAMNCHVLRQSRGSEDSRFNSKQYRGLVESAGTSQKDPLFLCLSSNVVITRLRHPRHALRAKGHARNRRTVSATVRTASSTSSSAEAQGALAARC